MTTILYDGIDPFSGIAPTPLVSRNVSMVQFGKRWAQRHDLSLKGQLTGRCITYQDFVDRQQQLISGFRRDLQSLQVYDEATLVTGYDYVEVKGINFDGNRYAQGYLPFDISLACYPEGYFSGDFGVLNPVNTFDFSEDEEGNVKISHKISAQGFSTDNANSDALENAKAWVEARTGWSSQILPAFISGISNGVCLQTLSENYDRLNAKYSVTESYVGDAFGNISGGLLRYTTDFSSGIDNGVCTIAVNGTVKGCKYQALSALRARYAGFDAFSEAVNRFEEITARTDINYLPLTRNISEDTNNRIISFGMVYTDDLRPIINIVTEIGFEYDYEADIISATIRATVSSRQVYDASKWAQVKAVADGINLHSLATEAYLTYAAEVAPHLVVYPLSPNPTTSSRTDNEFATTVTLSATYTNAPIPPAGLISYSNSISITPALDKYSAKPVLDGEGLYYVFDLGYKSRAHLQVEARGVGTGIDAPSILTGLTTNLRRSYFNGDYLTLDAHNHTSGRAPYGVAATQTASFSCDQAAFSL